MILSRDWLWDRKISIKKAKAILRNPQNERFLSLSSLLLSRKNTPREVFQNYLRRRDFAVNWNRIKRQMRKNSWNDPRIEYWQAIYEKLKEKYKSSEAIVDKKARLGHDFYEEVAGKITLIRKKQGLTQSKLAKKLKVTQQVISRIEAGKENISLNTLKKISDALGAKVSVDISVG